MSASFVGYERLEPWTDWAEEEADRVLHKVFLDSNRADRRKVIAEALRAAFMRGQANATAAASRG